MNFQLGRNFLPVEVKGVEPSSSACKAVALAIELHPQEVILGIPPDLVGRDQTCLDLIPHISPVPMWPVALWVAAAITTAVPLVNAEETKVEDMYVTLAYGVATVKR
jgi:hypothetical protein